MTRYVNCPVCNTRLKPDCYSEECFGVCEEYILCPVCNYRYQFTYGNYLEEIGTKQFIYDHYIFRVQDKSYASRLFKKMRKAKIDARRNWKKYKKKTTPQENWLPY